MLCIQWQLNFCIYIFHHRGKMVLLKSSETFWSETKLEFLVSHIFIVFIPGLGSRYLTVDLITEKYIYIYFISCNKTKNLYYMTDNLPLNFLYIWLSCTVNKFFNLEPWSAYIISISSVICMVIKIIVLTLVHEKHCMYIRKAKQFQSTQWYQLFLF